MKRIGAMVVLTAGLSLAGCGGEDPSAGDKPSSDPSEAKDARPPADGQVTRQPRSRPAGDRPPLRDAPRPDPAPERSSTDDKKPAVDDPADGEPTAPTFDAGAVRLRLAESVSENEALRSAAIEALDRLPNTAVSEIIAATRDTAGPVRAGALFQLTSNRWFNPQNEKLVQAILRALDDSDLTVRKIAVTGFGMLRVETQVSRLQRLALALSKDNTDAALRNKVATTIANLGESGSEALALVRRQLEAEPDPGVRTAWLNAMHRIAPQDKLSIEIYRDLLARDSSAVIRRLAAERLGEYGAQAAVAAKQLAVALADEEEDVRLAAARALAKIGPPAVAELTRRLKTSDRRAKILASIVLGDIGAEAKAALPELERLSASGDKEVRYWATKAVKKIRAATP